MDGPAEISNALAVNNPHLENALLLASREVGGQKLFNVARIKSVQIQLPFDGDLQGLVRRIFCIIRVHLAASTQEVITLIDVHFQAAESCLPASAAWASVCAMDSEMQPTVPPNPPSAPPLLPQPPRLPPVPPRKGRGWKVAALILGCLLFISLVFNPLHFVRVLLKGASTPTHTAGPKLEETIIEDNDSPNKIVVVPVEGIISSDMFDRDSYGMVDYIKDQLKVASLDDRVKAVVLKVNSPGGEVLASDDISNAITKFQKESHKPVIVSMGSLAASGGYYVSAPCRWIVANELTITGSIGVIMHAYNYRGLMNKVGLRPLVYKSGRFKDMLSGEKDLDQMSQQEKDDYLAEEKMVKDLIGQTFEKFKTVVAEGRQQANKKNEENKDSKGQPLDRKWADFADGRVLSGKEAFELGFVDELGNFETAIKRARKLAKIDSANLVHYQQTFDLSSFFRLLGKSEPPKIKIDAGLDTPRLHAGQLYFLSPTFAR